MAAKTHPITAIVILALFSGLMPCLETIKAADQTDEKILQERVNSMNRLKQMGTAILLYAGDNNEKCPEKLDDIKPYRGIDFDWIIANVCYIGSKLTMAAPPDTPVAFDNSMLAKGNGTVVLFNDGHVEFVSPVKLEKLGIHKGLCASGHNQIVYDKKQEKTKGNIDLKVVGPDGNSIKDAKVFKRYSVKDGLPAGKEYKSDSNGIFILAENDIFKGEWERKGVLLYAFYEDKLAGFLDVSEKNLGSTLEMKLAPACRVFGKIKSAELTKLGRDVNWTSVYLSTYNNYEIYCSGYKGQFEFLIPPGKYRLSTYGMSVYSKYEELEIKPGQKELEINFDLPADRVAQLTEKNAPELKDIKGWLYSKPLSLKNLCGKVVLLDFWGTWCGPCVAEIPKLIDLHEKYHDKGLVIVGIHDDSMDSIEKLETEINKLSKERWDGKKIPFAIALDGGENRNTKGTKSSGRGTNTIAYGIQKWPTLVLIDKQGKVVKEYNRGGDTEIIEKLLSAKYADSQ